MTNNVLLFLEKDSPPSTVILGLKAEGVAQKVYEAGETMVLVQGELVGEDSYFLTIQIPVVIPKFPEARVKLRVPCHSVLFLLETDEQAVESFLGFAARPQPQ